MQHCLSISELLGGVWQKCEVELRLLLKQNNKHFWRAFFIYSIKYRNLIVHWTGLENGGFVLWEFLTPGTFFILNFIKILQIWNSDFWFFSLCCPSGFVILNFEEVNRDWRVRKAQLPARDPTAKCNWEVSWVLEEVKACHGSVSCSAIAITGRTTSWLRPLY